jgi:flagellar basal body rod protein FlgC
VQPESLQRLVAKQQQRQKLQGVKVKAQLEVPDQKTTLRATKAKHDGRRERRGRRGERFQKESRVFPIEETDFKQRQVNEPHDLHEIMYEVQRVAAGVTGLATSSVMATGVNMVKEMLTMVSTSSHYNSNPLVVAAATQLAVSQQLASSTALGPTVIQKLLAGGFRALSSMAPCISAERNDPSSGMHLPSSGLHPLAKTLALEVGGDLGDLYYEEGDPNLSVQSHHDSNRLSHEAYPALQRASAVPISEENTPSRDIYGISHYGSVQYQDMLVPSGLLPSSVSGLPTSGDFQLVPRPPGFLSSLVPVPVRSRVLADKRALMPSMTVRVKAVGLNFRDLLVVSGCRKNIVAVLAAFIEGKLGSVSILDDGEVQGSVTDVHMAADVQFIEH